MGALNNLVRGQGVCNEDLCPAAELVHNDPRPRLSHTHMHTHTHSQTDRMNQVCLHILRVRVSVIGECARKQSADPCGNHRCRQGCATAFRSLDANDATEGCARFGSGRANSPHPSRGLFRVSGGAVRHRRGQETCSHDIRAAVAH